MTKRTKIILLILIAVGILALVFCLLYKTKKPLNTQIDPKNPLKNVDPETRGAPGYVPTLEETGQMLILQEQISKESIQTGVPAKIEEVEIVKRKELTDTERQAAPQYLE